MIEEQKNQGIQVISRAAGILRLLGQEKDGLSLGQIARAVELPRSTVQRIVSALAHEGFVSNSGGYGGITLGSEIHNLANASSYDLRDRIRPFMKQIAERTGETVDLAVLDKGSMLFIDQVVGSQRLRTVSSIGERFPLTTTANGKAALATLDQASAAKLMIAEIEGQDLPDRTLASLLIELEEIRAHGLAVDRDEHTDGISAIGMAVRDANGDVYSISTPVPSSRFDRVMDQLSTELQHCREALSSNDFAA